MELLAQGLLDEFAHIAAQIPIKPLVDIPHDGQTFSGFRVDMPTVSMDNGIVLLGRRFCPVNHFVDFAIDCELVCSIGYPCDIIGMGIPVHVVVHEYVSFFFAEPEQLAEALGKRNRNNPPVYKLVNRERDAGILKQSFFIRI